MRYHLFAGYNYYPEAGLGDYEGSFDEENEAIEVGKAAVNTESHGPDWWLVITERDGNLLETAGGYRGKDD
jgi:hypothetical protein